MRKVQPQNKLQKSGHSGMRPSGSGTLSLREGADRISQPEIGAPDVTAPEIRYPEIGMQEPFVPGVEQVMPAQGAGFSPSGSLEALSLLSGKEKDYAFEKAKEVVRPATIKTNPLLPPVNGLVDKSLSAPATTRAENTVIAEARQEPEEKSMEEVLQEPVSDNQQEQVATVPDLNPEVPATEVTKVKAQAEGNPEMQQKGVGLAVEVINKAKEQQSNVTSTLPENSEKLPEQQNNQEEAERFKVSTQQQVFESKVQQTERIAAELNKSSQQDSIGLDGNEKEQVETETSLKTAAKEPVGASQLEEEIEDMPVEQVSQTPKEASASLIEPDPVQEQDFEAQEANKVSNEGTQQSDAGQESIVENVSAAANETIIHLEDLEKSHTDSLNAYHRITQKNIRTLNQQSEKALQALDVAYHQQVGLIESGYGNAIRKVKKALSTTLSDLSKGKSSRRKKLTSIIENKVKKTGYLTWNKQQEAGAMGSEFVGKTWKYTNELKGDSDKKASDQKKEIKSNGADAKRKYKNHKYHADVNEAVDESVFDYCKTINESTADLKETLTEDAGEMVTNFKQEAVDLKALLPQGKQQVIQNIQAIGRDGAKQFNKVDQDVLPTLRKQMHIAESELHRARKQALIALKNAWIQSRQGVKEQQKELELKLRGSEQQAVEENKQVMAEVRAEHSQDPAMESQLGEINALMQKSPGELAAAQQNLLKQGGLERQKGLQSARKGMTTLASGSVKQAQKMADTAVHGATKLKAGALKGYDQVVSGTEMAMNDELSRYERSLDKILGKTRGDWSKKLSQGTWGMRKKAHEVWYENGKLRKGSRSELFAVAKDASEIDFWDVLEVIGNFLLGVLLVIGAILLVLVLVWAIGALLASLGAWLVALTAEYAIGSLVAALVVGIEMLITSILSSTVFWVAASSYGIYSGYKTIKEAKNNPNLTRSDAAYEYGSGTAEIILSIIPFWSKFKGGIKSKPPKSTPKQNYENYGGEFEDDFARMGTQQEPLMNKPPANKESISEVNDFAKNKKSGKFAEESSLEKGVNSAGKVLQVVDQDGFAIVRSLNNEFVGRAWLSTGNEFNLTIITKGTSLEGKGREVFQSLFNYVNTEYDEILSIRGTWRSSDAVADNLNTFNEFVSGGMSPNEAALKTFTGKMAIEHQFTNATVQLTSIIRPDGTYSSVDVLFTK